ncbi:hypothetical protein I4F81_001361 [Pyropia yezoensis]|uniref:Uncharacterized protein n=1 Tax=Pyropia yezoensis TaxID=2788 RepID=A0ACC3BLB9_PYRYE|nr:hypothetical protein I4F81_001361 [Neopyropia yezoensis]
MVDAASRQAASTAVVAQLRLLGEAVDVGFIALTGVLVLTMQTGFAMLTAGSVRAKNVKSVLMKVLMDTCLGGVAWMLFGNAFAHGEKASSFIGHSGWALAGGETADLAVFFFRWTLSATAATIVSGAVAERASFYAYLGATLWLSSFVYPVVAHGVWDSTGWLSALSPSPLLGVGAIDHAGCGVVHLVGAVTGLWGAIATGPRLGRFAVDGTPRPIPGHSAPLILLGGFILWTGWFGFNAGSGLSLVPYEAASGLFSGSTQTLADGSVVAQSGLLTVQQTLASTMLGACGGALVGVALCYCLAAHVIDLGTIVNCLLAGLVSITAGCATFPPYISLLVGMAGAAIYMAASRAMRALRIDDPLDAVAIHGAGGLWGLASVGLFSAATPQAAAGFRAAHFGAAFGGGWRLLACQATEAGFVIGWTTATTVPLWWGLRAAGLLRVSRDEEAEGIDEVTHGGSAYPADAAASPWHSPKGAAVVPEHGGGVMAVTRPSPAPALEAVMSSGSPLSSSSGPPSSMSGPGGAASAPLTSSTRSGGDGSGPPSGRPDPSRAIMDEMHAAGGSGEGRGWVGGVRAWSPRAR